MSGARSQKLNLTSTLLTALALLGGCSSKTTRSPQGNQPLTTVDGVEISYESVRCIYRQNTGSDDTVSLQIQYLDTPDTVAFAMYIDDPRPARPFSATPGEVGAWAFEAAVDGTMYGRNLTGAEATLELETLPATSSLAAGETVALRGRVRIGALSLPQQAPPDGSAGATLEVAGGDVSVDCAAEYDETLILD